MSNTYINLPLSTAVTTWKDPVANFAALPASGNTIGDARIALDSFIIYVWNGSAWVAAGTAGVSSLNSETGAINITAGPGITVTPSGQNIQIASITPTAVSAIQLTLTAVGTVTAFQMVVSVTGTTASTGNDNTTFQNASVIGIALTSATNGNTFTALLFGTTSDASFSGFTLNNPVYLNTTGFLTQTLPVRPNFLVNCGKYIGANTVFIDINQPVQL